MKIFAVINNFPESDAGSPFSIPASGPDWYEMPDSSILRSGNPFFVPDFAGQFKAFPSIVYRIGRLGKSIAPRFASRYIDGWTIGAAVVATDLLSHLRAHGAPWTRATAFDRSLLLGNLQPVDSLLNLDTVKISDGTTGELYHPGRLIKNIDNIIARLSVDNTLKNGDLILAGLLPPGLQLTPGQRLTASTDSDTLLDIIIK